MIEHFSKDEAAHLQWVQSHQHRHAVRLEKAQTYPQYPMVDRASHKLISSPGRTNYTTNEFIKVCSTDLAALSGGRKRNAAGCLAGAQFVCSWGNAT